MAKMTHTEARIVLGLAGRSPFTSELADRNRTDVVGLAAILWGPKGLFARGILEQLEPGSAPTPTQEAIMAAEAIAIPQSARYRLKQMSGDSLDFTKPEARNVVEVNEHELPKARDLMLRTIRSREAYSSDWILVERI